VHARSAATFHLPGELLDINPLELLPRLIVENSLWRLAGDLFERGPLILGLKVPVDEVLHLGELQTHKRLTASTGNFHRILTWDGKLTCRR
jgi:hypothetical protein